MVVTCLNYMDERIYSGIDAIEMVLAKYEIELGEVFVFAGDRVSSLECGGGCEPHLMHVEKQISRAIRASRCDSDSPIFIDELAFPVVPGVENLSPWRGQ